MPESHDLIDRAVKSASQVFRSRATHPTDMTLTYDGWVQSYFARKARDGRERDADAMHAETIAAKAVKECQPVEAAWAARYAAHAAWAVMAAASQRAEAARTTMEFHKRDALEQASVLEGQAVEFATQALAFAEEAAAKLGQQLAA